MNRNILKLSRSQWTGVAVLASSVGLAVAVTIPNTFTAGTTISASQMNANFSALATAINNSNLSAQVFSSTQVAVPVQVTPVEIIGINFTCPADGFVIAQGQIVADINHTTGIADNMNVKVAAAVDASFPGPGWTLVFVPGPWPTSATVKTPVQVGARIPCTGGAAARYGINAQMVTGVAALAGWGTLIVQYSPT